MGNQSSKIRRQKVRAWLLELPADGHVSPEDRLRLLSDLKTAPRRLHVLEWLQSLRETGTITAALHSSLLNAMPLLHDQVSGCHPRTVPATSVSDFLDRHRYKRRYSANPYMIVVDMEIPGTASAIPVNLLLDTGSQFNVLSRSFADRLHPDLKDLQSAVFPLANSAGGRLYTRGECSLWWHYNHVRFPKRFVETTFQLAEIALEVDAIIGWPDINALGLLNPEATAFVGYMSPDPTVNSATLVHNDTNWLARRRVEADQRAYDLYLEQRENYARRQADLYAEQHRLQHGVEICPQARQAVYQQALNSYPPQQS